MFRNSNYNQAPDDSGGSHSNDDHPADTHSSSSKPAFMTVGTGSPSESAARLTALLDDDSGYGGSMYDGDSSSRAWQSAVTQQRQSLYGDAPQSMQCSSMRQALSSFGY